MEVNVMPRGLAMNDPISRADFCVPLVVISPHLDDAVFSCGDLLRTRPGSIVVTVFAGHPRHQHGSTSWDERCGFAGGADVVTHRRAEDAAALAHLGATPRWLEIVDPQYGGPAVYQEVSTKLTEALAVSDPCSVAAPLGLVHDDHRVVSDAALELARDQPAWHWFCYADAIYRQVPDAVPERLRRLEHSGFTFEACDAPAPHDASADKRRATGCYRSQLRGLERSWEQGIEDIYRGECYWRVSVSGSSAPRTP
jgi:LmbE family N-acetylglucosaminyl deacetylase